MSSFLCVAVTKWKPSFNFFLLWNAFFIALLWGLNFLIAVIGLAQLKVRCLSWVYFDGPIPPTLTFAFSGLLTWRISGSEKPWNPIPHPNSCHFDIWTFTMHYRESLYISAYISLYFKLQEETMDERESTFLWDPVSVKVVCSRRPKCLMA